MLATKFSVFTSLVSILSIRCSLLSRIYYGDVLWRKLQLLSVDSDAAPFVMPILARRVSKLTGVSDLDVNHDLPAKFAAIILPQLTTARLRWEPSLPLSPQILINLELHQGQISDTAVPGRFGSHNPRSFHLAKAPTPFGFPVAPSGVSIGAQPGNALIYDMIADGSALSGEAGLDRVTWGLPATQALGPASGGDPGIAKTQRLGGSLSVSFLGSAASYARTVLFGAIFNAARLLSNTFGRAEAAESPFGAVGSATPPFWSLRSDFVAPLTGSGLSVRGFEFGSTVAPDTRFQPGGVSGQNLFEPNSFVSAGRFIVSNTFPKLKRLSLTGIREEDTEFILKFFREADPHFLALRFPCLESIAAAIPQPATFSENDGGFGLVGNSSLLVSSIMESLASLRQLKLAVRTLRHVDLHLHHRVRQLLSSNADFLMSLPRLIGLPFSGISVDSNEAVWDVLLFPLDQNPLLLAASENLFHACFQTPTDQLSAVSRTARRFSNSPPRNWTRAHFQRILKLFLDSKIPDPILAVQLLATLASSESSLAEPNGILRGFQFPPSVQPLTGEEILLIAGSIFERIELAHALAVADSKQKLLIERAIFSHASSDWLIDKGLANYYFHLGVDQLSNIPPAVWQVLIAGGILDRPAIRSDPELLCGLFFKLGDRPEAAEAVLDLMLSITTRSEQGEVLLRLPFSFSQSRPSQVPLQWRQLLADDDRAVKCGTVFCDAYQTIFSVVPLGRYKLFLESCLGRWYGRSWESKDDQRLEKLIFVSSHTLTPDPEEGFAEADEVPVLRWAMEYFKVMSPEIELLLRMSRRQPPLNVDATASNHESPILSNPLILSAVVGFLPIHLIQLFLLSSRFCRSLARILKIEDIIVDQRHSNAFCLALIQADDIRSIRILDIPSLGEDLRLLLQENIFPKLRWLDLSSLTRAECSAVLQHPQNFPALEDLWVQMNLQRNHPYFGNANPAYNDEDGEEDEDPEQQQPDAEMDYAMATLRRFCFLSPSLDHVLIHCCYQNLKHFDPFAFERVTRLPLSRVSFNALGERLWTVLLHGARLEGDYSSVASLEDSYLFDLFRACYVTQYQKISALRLVFCELLLHNFGPPAWAMSVLQTAIGHAASDRALSVALLEVLCSFAVMNNTSQQVASLLNHILKICKETSSFADLRCNRTPSSALFRQMVHQRDLGTSGFGDIIAEDANLFEYFDRFDSDATSVIMASPKFVNHPDFASPTQLLRISQKIADTLWSNIWRHNGSDQGSLDSASSLEKLVGRFGLRLTVSRPFWQLAEFMLADSSRAVLFGSIVSDAYLQLLQAPGVLVSCCTRRTWTPPISRFSRRPRCGAFKALSGHKKKRTVSLTQFGLRESFSPRPGRAANVLHRRASRRCCGR